MFTTELLIVKWLTRPSSRLQISTSFLVERKTLPCFFTSSKEADEVDFFPFFLPEDDYKIRESGNGRTPFCQERNK